MIAKVSRGADGVGLARYLFGPGRENEHSEQRVIAASTGVEVEHAVPLNREQVLDLGHQLEGPRALFGTEVGGGHIWHLSLTNPAVDRSLSEAEWSRIVERTMDRLGFSEAPGRAGCPWVAVGHGKSAAGNEHVHVAVSLVRNDGSVASIHRDRVKLSELCSTFERDYGLTVVDGRNRDGLPGVSRAEDELAARRGRAEPERDTLARSVRACSVASRSEAEFVGRLRVEGVSVRPRYGKGGEREVAGYSVALKPAQAGAEPVWFGGGTLAKDLRLPALRATWDRSPTAQREALAAWKSERSPTFEPKKAGAFDRATERVRAVNGHLERLSPADTARWSSTAREATGVVGQLAARLEPSMPGPLAEAADALARSAQLERGDLAVVRDGPVADLRGVAGVAGQTPLRPSSGPEVARMVTELSTTVDRVAGAHAARGEHLSAARLGHASAGMIGVASALAAGGLAVDRVASKLIGGELDRSPSEEEEEDERRHHQPSRGHQRDQGFGR